MTVIPLPLHTLSYNQWMAEIDKRISELFVRMEKMETQAKHLEAIVDSEKGTLQREATRLREEMKEVENGFREVMYDSENGLLIKLDRLVQESQERKKVKQHIYALWVMIGGMIIKELLSFFNNK